jgi:hypothetical protein
MGIIFIHTLALIVIFAAQEVRIFTQIWKIGYLAWGEGGI